MFGIVEDGGAFCSRNRQFPFVFEWRVERDWPKGTVAELRSHCLRSFLSWKHVRKECDTGTKVWEWLSYPSVSDLFKNPDFSLLRVRFDKGLAAGQTVRFRMQVVPPLWAGIDSRIELHVCEAPTGNLKDTSPGFKTVVVGEDWMRVNAGPVERMSVYARGVAEDDRVRTALVPEDRFGNPSAFVSAVSAKLEWEGEVREIRVKGPQRIDLPTPSGTARAVVSLPMWQLDVRENVANGERIGDLLRVTGNPVWPAPPGGLKPAFGEFHWHTDHSFDGQRTLEQALESAHDTLNLDWAVPGDHNPMDGKWQNTVEELDRFNRPGEFVTFYGWENATTHGHENYYFLEADHPLICGGEASINSQEPASITDNLRTLFSKSDFFAVPHHTNSDAEILLDDGEPVWDVYPWGEPEDYLRLVEVFQCRGNQEQDFYDDAWRGWRQDNGSSVQEALRRGHRLGFTGGTDNHCGWPGRGYALSEVPIGANHPEKSVQLTGVWTPKVERRAVYESLKNRATWAVWDTRALVWWEVNGTRMGQVLDGDASTTLKGRLRVSAEDAHQALEVVSDSEVVWSGNPSALDLDFDIELPKPKSNTYFYVRGLLRNGGIYYASPVFVTIS